jgi:hypothetical protein
VYFKKCLRNFNWELSCRCEDKIKVNPSGIQFQDVDDVSWPRILVSSGSVVLLF